MPFECKKYHCQCEAKCCSYVPIPQKIWQRNQHNIQREVIEKTKVIRADGNETAILPITESGYCPFLKEDLSCAIYQDRPEICKKFGDESHPLMCCPMQDKNGKHRQQN